MTNAYHPVIKDIYGELGEFTPLNRKSLVGGKGAERKTVTEYILTNC
jgi:hypothetical protein